jgi:hypothetical protein
LEKCEKQGKTVEEAKETLINYGFDPKLVEKFIREIHEGKT